MRRHRIRRATTISAWASLPPFTALRDLDKLSESYYTVRGGLCQGLKSKERGDRNENGNDERELHHAAGNGSAARNHTELPLSIALGGPGARSAESRGGLAHPRSCSSCRSKGKQMNQKSFGVPVSQTDTPIKPKTRKERRLFPLEKGGRRRPT